LALLEVICVREKSGGILAPVLLHAVATVAALFL
jgi:hypothetical protein